MVVTLINAISVILGSFVGLLLKKYISSNFKTIVMTAAGSVTLVLALKMVVFSSVSEIPILFSLIIGGLIGYAIKLEDRIISLGDRAQKIRLKKKTINGVGVEIEGEKEGSFGLGFLNASILFCSGSMSIVGSIQAGTTGDGKLILIKSVMDGFMAIVFASAYGKGVILSSLVIVIYQGFFVLTSSFIEPILGESGISAISVSGGYLLIMIALSLLELKKVKTANFLPSLILSPLFLYAFSLLKL